MSTPALSLEQEAASEQLSGPVRIVAGAGTGKTAVIAERFQRVVAAGADPADILVMTFSERAASEMRERILRRTGLESVPNVGTFHSLAMRWLRDHGRLVGVGPGFRILTGPERWIVMRELMWEQAADALIGSERPDDLVLPLLKLHERARQELVPLNRLHAWLPRVDDEERRAVLAAGLRLFGAYEARCRREGLMDFDDVLAHTVRLLEEQPGVLEHLRERFPWVLVDEYQDTNLAQERIVELIGGAHGNVCVVGDDDQSIYRFRGASRASMDRFIASFPTATTLHLGRNRRSSRNIFAAARALIERSLERLDKPLAADPDREEGAPVEAWQCTSAEHEAALIAQEAARAVAAGTPWGRMAVLVRTHAIARPVAAALAGAGVPFQHLAGRGLYRRPEVRDLVAYLRLLHDPDDVIALSRLLARPPLGLDLAEAVSWPGFHESPMAAMRAWPATASWSALVAELSGLRATLGVDDLLFEVLSRTRHLDALLAATADGDEARRVVANVSRFAEVVGEYCDHRRDHSLGLFVEYLGLVMRSGLDEDVADVEGAEDAVQLMTIHQAKGLEFDLVFVPSLAEGRLPQPRRRDSVAAVGGLELPPQLLEPAVRGREDQLAEERRLLYVAMTRARERLVLSWAERYEGGRPWRRSRFLDDLGDAVVEVDRREHGEVPPSGAGAPPQGGRNDELVLSYSGIAAYRECPRQHWFRYRLRLPAAPTVEAQLGSIVHAVLMRAGRGVRDGQPLAKAQLADLHRQAWAEAELVEPRRRPALEALAWRLLEAFFDSGGLVATPRLIESPFRLSLDGWTLRGVIDRVDEPAEPGGPWRIVDYKTGRPVPASRLRRDLQLALYALGARDALGLAPAELELAYLRDGHRVTLEAGEELLAEARAIGGEVAEGIRDGAFEPRPERRRCALCPYRLACAAAL